MTKKIAYLFANQDAVSIADQEAEEFTTGKGPSVRQGVGEFADAVLYIAQFLLVGALLVGLPMAFFLSILAAPISGSTYAEWFVAEYLRFVQNPVFILAPIVVLLPLTRSVLRVLERNRTTAPGGQ